MSVPVVSISMFCLFVFLVLPTVLCSSWCCWLCIASFFLPLVVHLGCCCVCVCFCFFSEGGARRFLRPLLRLHRWCSPSAFCSTLQYPLVLFSFRSFLLFVAFACVSFGFFRVVVLLAILVVGCLSPPCVPCVRSCAPIIRDCGGRYGLAPSVAVWGPSPLRSQSSKKSVASLCLGFRHFGPGHP